MANSLLFTCVSRSSKCTSTGQARANCLLGAGALFDGVLAVVPRAWCGRRKESSCFGGLKSTFRCAGAGDRSRFTSMCRFRGRCCALDLAISDSVARAVNREPWTCGLFFHLQAYMSLPLRGALQIAKHGPCHEICTSRLTTCPTWHEVRPSGFLSPASAFRKKSTRCQRHNTSPQF